MVKNVNVIDVIIGNTLLNTVAASPTVDLSATVDKQLQFVSADLSRAVDAAGIAALGPVIIVQGSTAFARISLPIDPTSVDSWERIGYAAATVLVKTATIVDVPVAGKEYVIQIADKTDFEYVNKPRKRYAVIAAAGETIATLTVKFAAAINADPTKYCSATSTATTVVCTAVARDVLSKAYETNFDIALGGTFTSASTVATTTPPFKGTGTYDQVSILEEVAKGYKGSMNRSEYVVTPPYFADPAKTYVTYVIRHRRAVVEQAAARAGEDFVNTFLFVDSTDASAAAGIATGTIGASLTALFGASKKTKTI